MKHSCKQLNCKMKTPTVLLFCFISSTFASQDGYLVKSGPYKTTLIRVGKCEKPSVPYDKNPAFMYYSESYISGGKLLLKANLTVSRIISNVKFHIRAFMKEGDRWKIMYMNRSAGCRSLMISALKIIFNVTQQTSCIPKGSYTNKDMSFDDFQHRWLKTFMYGKFLWTMEILTKTGTNVCWQYETDITPDAE